jgi:hypothetical protein
MYKGHFSNPQKSMLMIGLILAIAPILFNQQILLPGFIKGLISDAGFALIISSVTWNLVRTGRGTEPHIQQPGNKKLIPVSGRLK